MGVVRHEREGHVGVDGLLDTLEGTLLLQVGLPLHVGVDGALSQYRHHHLHDGPAAHGQRVDKVGGAEHGQHGAVHHLLELLDTEFPLAVGLAVGEEGDGALILILEIQPGPAEHFLLESPGVELLAVPGPVQAPLLHGDEVVGAGGQEDAVQGHGVSVVLSAAEGEEYSRPKSLVIEPGSILVDCDLGVQEEGHPLREARGGGPEGRVE